VDFGERVGLFKPGRIPLDKSIFETWEKGFLKIEGIFGLKTERAHLGLWPDQAFLLGPKVLGVERFARMLTKLALFLTFLGKKNSAFIETFQHRNSR